jgi:thioredoxin 1|tara:strand:+ start:6598 stop:6924 length:327 start_codon:yes stop_codon:yes gene_type:complete
MSDLILKITDAEFENQVIKSEKPILVDYWAEWCGPCKMIAPVLEEVASEMSDKVLIGKLNVDENSQTPPKYGIRGIPTLMLFKNGEPVGTQVGAVNKNDLIKFIEDNI